MNLHALLNLTNAVAALAARGDVLNASMPASTQNVATAAVQVLSSRIMRAHCRGQGRAPHDLQSMADMILALDQLASAGDGSPEPMDEEMRLTLARLRRDVLARMELHPGGNVAASLINRLPEAIAARNFVPLSAEQGESYREGAMVAGGRVSREVARDLVEAHHRPAPAPAPAPAAATAPEPAAPEGKTPEPLGKVVAVLHPETPDDMHKFIEAWDAKAAPPRPEEGQASAESFRFETAPGLRRNVSASR